MCAGWEHTQRSHGLVALELPREVRGLVARTWVQEKALGSWIWPLFPEPASLLLICESGY